MKNILKISAIITIPILGVAIFIALLVGSALLRNMSVQIEGQYSISSDGFLEKDYNPQSKTGHIYNDGLYVKDYTHNEDFILLDTWKRNDGCTKQESPWFIANTEGNIEMLKCFSPALYIVEI